jgi:tetratricopeptide (TPR) repeat protein
MGRAAPAAVLLAVLSMSSTASAADPPESLFQEGAAALARGEYGTAIERFEAMSDLGFTHPDASFDRGLAYVARVRAGADRPGDLGRAAAAFEEALRLRPGDGDADRALDLVRAEVTRRRARRSTDTASVRPTLDRVVVGLASERAWSLLALAASSLLAVGLVLRTRPRGPLQVTGRILAPTALVLLCVLVPLAIGARRLRLTTRPGVVVVPEAHLVDEDGTALGGDPIPEAASVEVGDTRGALIHVRWGATEGWVVSGSVRLLGL